MRRVLPPASGDTITDGLASGARPAESREVARESLTAEANR
ncbi:hypothetical protein [Nonomuraea rhodomycinica]|nr:hypothetical protein [Nonomuraea rhodomycinica]